MKQEPPASRFVGQSVHRKEDRRLLTGQGGFVDDQALPGMLHAAFVRSPYAKAAIRRLDAEAARGLAGVHAVFTGADMARIVKPLRNMHYSAGMPHPHVLPLAEGDVRYAGDPVALVIADDRYLAEDAAELVEVEYDSADPVVDYLHAAAGPPVHPELGSNLVLESA